MPIIIFIIWFLLFLVVGTGVFVYLAIKKNNETNAKWKAEGLFESVEYSYYDRSCQCDHLCGSKKNECYHGE